MSDRRPLASRETGWAAAAVRLLLRTRVTPNGVSMAGVGFAALGGAAFAWGPAHLPLFVAGALLVQARLLCNLFDGMVAVEGGRGGPTGALYNELPDRVEDSLLLIGFGYGVGAPELGFVASILAVGTAYLRAVGASLGLGQDFRGPMAKPQRMAALTIGAPVVALELWLHATAWTGVATLALVVAGAVVTCWRRTARMGRLVVERAR